jgi:hypothetical protein
MSFVIATESTSQRSAAISPYDFENVNRIVRENLEPFEQVATRTSTGGVAHFVDGCCGATWTLSNGAFKNSIFTFRGGHKIEDEDGDSFLRFTCTGWLHIPLGIGNGFPVTYADIYCGDEDGTRVGLLSSLRLTRVVGSKRNINTI